jgi:hypothetical protein
MAEDTKATFNATPPVLDDPENYEIWRIQFEAFQIRCPTTEDKMIAANIIGSLNTSILRDLHAQFSDGKLLEKTSKVLFDTLDKMFKKEKLEMARKAHLFEMRQKGRPLEDFMNLCKREANSCDWSGFDADKAASLVFVIGVDDGNIRKHLLMHAEKKTSNDILSAAQIIYESVQEANAFAPRSTVHAVSSGHYKTPRRHSPNSKAPYRRSGSPPNQSETKEFRCHRCDSPDHIATHCPHSDKKCDFCGITGHLARACNKKKRYEQDKPPHRSNHSRISHIRDQDKLPWDTSLHSNLASKKAPGQSQTTANTSQDSPHPTEPGTSCRMATNAQIRVPILINGEMDEIFKDDELFETFLDEATLREFGNPAIQPSRMKYVSMHGTRYDVVGQVSIQAKRAFSDATEKELKAFIYKGNGLNYMGKNWSELLGFHGDDRNKPMSTGQMRISHVSAIPKKTEALRSILKKTSGGKATIQRVVTACESRKRMASGTSSTEIKEEIREGTSSEEPNLKLMKPFNYDNLKISIRPSHQLRDVLRGDKFTY